MFTEMQINGYEKVLAAIYTQKYTIAEIEKMFAATYGDAVITAAYTTYSEEEENADYEGEENDYCDYLDREYCASR